VEPTPKHKSLAVASGATPIGNAVRVPDEIIKKKERMKRRKIEEQKSIFRVINNSAYTPIGRAI
jgi:hypothetical protein